MLPDKHGSYTVHARDTWLVTSTFYHTSKKRIEQWFFYGDVNFGYTKCYDNIGNKNIPIIKFAHVEALPGNLLSVNQLWDNGLIISFISEKCEIINRSTNALLLTGYRKDKFYFIDFEKQEKSMSLLASTPMLRKMYSFGINVWHI